jgi:TPP-dependent trihydroxycyclohexane-1,2-dione (THcHDO) dehydratase
VSSHDVSEHTIRPYDPDLFFHHQAHNDPPRESGQRAPDEVAYYEAIAKAVALGGPIVVAGHGTGHSNAARHLIAYLQSHHHDIYQRVVREIEADLSACTVPQLLDLARGALHGEAGAPNHGRDVK